MENQQQPLGFTAKTDEAPLITFQQLFELFRLAEVVSGWALNIKQENLTKEKIKYYYKEDLVETEDEQGNKVQKLRDDFWN